MKSTRLVGPRRRPLTRSNRPDIAFGNQEPPGADLGGRRGDDVAHPFRFFDRLCRTFAEAEDQFHRRIERHYRIGGSILRLRFAGPALVSPIVPALEHLASDPVTSADLTVLLWDSRTTSTIMPRPPWPPADYLARGEIRGYEYGPFRACLSTAPTTFCMLAKEARLAVFWIEDAGRMPTYEQTAPLRVIFNWWLSDGKRQVAHAAAVGRTDGGVLIVGKGGSGKSTTASACLDSPLAYASDDYCLITTTPSPHVYSLYNSANIVKRRPTTSRSPPRPTPAAQDERRQKPFVFLHEQFPGKISRGFPITALLLPRFTDGSRSSITPASPGTALRALAPSTMYQLPGTTEQSFRVMASLVRRISSYHLDLGTDLTTVPSLISDVLDRGW